MQPTDWPLVGRFRSKLDHQQGQRNRAERDGYFLLLRIIEEFGDEPFSEEKYLDAFYAYVPTSVGDHKLNVKAALRTLIENGYIHEKGSLFRVTDEGRNFADYMEPGFDWESDEDDFD